MSSETNAVPDRKSLLDQIHDAAVRASLTGQPELAEWMRKHADEPCPAAIAEAMALPADVPIFNGRSEELAFWLGRRFTATRGHRCPCGCGAVYGSAPADDKSGAVPSEPSHSDAVKEAIARIEQHVACSGGHRCRADEEQSCFLMRQMRPLLAALADAEHESARYKDELAAATKRERALEERVIDADAKTKEKAAEAYRLGVAALDSSIGKNRALEIRLVDADKLAKAEHEAVHRSTGIILTERQRNAALTSKLATAREAITGSLASIAYLTNGGLTSDLQTLANVKRKLEAGIAAIYAPAGEGTSVPTPRIIDAKFRAEVRDGRVVIVKTSSGEIVPEDEPLMLQRGRDHLMVATLNHYRTSEHSWHLCRGPNNQFQFRGAYK